MNQSKDSEIDLSEIFVVEYSPSQQAWHVDSLDTAITANIRAFLRGSEDENDWTILGACLSREEASKIARKLRKAKADSIHKDVEEN